MPFLGGWDVRLFERAERLALVGKKVGGWSLRKPPVFAMAFPWRCWSVQRLKLLPGGGSFSASVLPATCERLSFDTPGSHSEEIKNCAFLQAVGMSVFSKERRGVPLPGRRLSTRLLGFSVYLQWPSRTASCAGRRLVLGKGMALSLRQLCLPLAKGFVFDIPGSHSEEIENCAFRLVQVQAGRPLPGRWSVCLFGRAGRLAPVGRKGRRLVFRDSLCICNGVSPEMLVWATVEACSRAVALLTRQFCLWLGSGLPFWPLLCERRCF